MSLLDEYMEEFTILDKRTNIPDGYGGQRPGYVDGAKIKGAMTFDSSTEMKIAQAQGVTSAYTFTVSKSIELDYHTVLRRDSDGVIFRITSNSDDKKTPESASLDMRQYTAELYTIPAD